MMVHKIYEDAVLPTKAHEGDAGWDLYASYSKTIEPWGIASIGTGIAVAIPDGHVGIIAERSSLGLVGLAVRGGIVDATYRGEVRVILQNLSKIDVHILKGHRIAQLLVLPISGLGITVEDGLPSSSRGPGGFGSSGR